MVLAAWVWEPEFRFSRIHVKAKITDSDTLALEGRDRQILGTPWPARIAETVTSKFTERPCLKSISLRAIEDSWRWPLESACLDKCTHAHLYISEACYNNHIKLNLFSFLVIEPRLLHVMSMCALLLSYSLSSFKSFILSYLGWIWIYSVAR